MSMSSKAYESIDLSHEGAVAGRLFDQVDKEAAQSPISLSSEDQADPVHPAFLTPAMQVWYKSEIAPLRGPALDEIEASFKSIDLGKGQFGFLLEAERDRLTKRKFAAWRSERDQFFADGKAAATAVALDEKLYEYEAMKAANGGDEAREWPASRYLAAYVLLALPEVPLNFESFMQVPAVTPAIALALTLIAAAGIGFSSHVCGVVFRQWGERFGGNVGRKERLSSARFLSLGWLVFAVSMGVVGWGRTLLFREEIERKLMIGDALGFSDYVGLGGSLGGNFLIWGLGVLVAYMAHSPIPGFGDMKKDVDRLRAKLDDFYGRELQPRVQTHLNAAAKDIVQFERLEARSLRTRPEYVAARRQFEVFKSVDSRVVSILDLYRARLASKIREGQLKSTFVIGEIARPSPDMRVEIEVEGYEQKRFHLPYA